MLTVRTSENTVITSFRLITERQDFSSVRTAENTVRARARIHLNATAGKSNQNTTKSSFSHKNISGESLYQYFTTKKNKFVRSVQIWFLLL